jgi:hypothetical protein
MCVCVCARAFVLVCVDVCWCVCVCVCVCVFCVCVCECLMFPFVLAHFPLLSIHFTIQWWHFWIIIGRLILAEPSPQSSPPRAPSSRIVSPPPAEVMRSPMSSDSRQKLTARTIPMPIKARHTQHAHHTHTHTHTREHTCTPHARCASVWCACRRQYGTYL